jgi:hypothetical protein
MGGVAVVGADAFNKRAGCGMKKTDPGAMARVGAGGDQVRGEELPDTTDRRNEPEHPLPWLSNLSPIEYESLRRRLARQYGWRVATLDRQYREARREARSR